MTLVTPSTNAPIKVPNVPPSLPFNGLAIVGEAPGSQELAEGKPFVGPSGLLLNEVLSKAKLLRSACFVGNICQHRPPGNDITQFVPSGPEISGGLSSLLDDLRREKPKVILALGNTALSSLTGLQSVSKRRGSIYWNEELQCKVIPSIHPAAILREWSNLPLLIHDTIRAADELSTPYEPQERDLVTHPLYHEIRRVLRSYREEKRIVSFDIEGYVDAWEMCSLSNDRGHAIVIDWRGSELTLPEKLEIWGELKALLEDPTIPKVLQNSLYDRFVLAYSYGILIRNVAEDTMLKHWEIYPEFPKGLGFLCSLYTKYPYYKDGRDAKDSEVKLRYAALDACITLECMEVIGEDMDEQDKSHYSFNVSLLNPLLYMELRGFKYDSAAAAEALGRGMLEAELLSLQVTCAAGRELNVESPKQCKQFLYDERGYPPYINRKTKQPTCDEAALRKMAERYPADLALRKIMALRRRNTINGILSAKGDKDGRIRCSYNLVGTETGRLSCSKSPTRSGFNLQTVPKSLRYLFRADDDNILFQADLKGADAWTVAAHCYSQGDRTMLEDMLEGIKVAKVIALLFRGGSLAGISRGELKQRCGDISNDDPIYFGSKCCQHGTNYDMKSVTMSDTIYEQSEGEVSLPASVCAGLQRSYLSRYPGIKMWHKWVERQLWTVGKLTDASGHSRTFFGRRGAHDTFKAALAHEPQANTTYATNLAMLRLWRAPENRRPDGSLWVEPLHSVHDALVGQFPADRIEWALPFIKSCFDNRITIAGVPLTIPFEGGYGPSWGECKTEF